MPHTTRYLIALMVILAIAPTANAVRSEGCLLQLPTTLIIVVHENGSFPVTGYWANYKCFVNAQTENSAASGSSAPPPRLHALPDGSCGRIDALEDTPFPAVLGRGEPCLTIVALHA